MEDKEENITPQEDEEVEEEEERTIDIVKMQREVQITKPQCTVTLLTQCISEDMEYLVEKAIEIMKGI